MGRLDGKIALVVGGGADGPPNKGETLSIGNGRATAILCAREGAAVMIADRAQSLALRLVVEPIARGTASGRYEQTERFVVKERGAREPYLASQSSESQSCHDGKASRSGERKR